MIRYLPAYIVPMLASIAGIAIFTRLLPAQDYGLYVVIFSVIQMAQSLLFSWAVLAIKRFYESSRREAKIGALTVTIYRWMLLGALLLAACAFGVEQATAFGLIRLDQRLTNLLWLAVAAALVRQLSVCSKAFALSALTRFRYVAMECSDSILALAVGAALCFFLPLGAAAILLGMIAGGFAVLAMDLPNLARRLWHGRIDAGLQRRLIRFGAPLALAYFFEYVLANSDRLLIGHFLGAGPVGVYAASYSLADRSLASVFTALAISAYPKMVQAHEHEGRSGAARQAAENIRILLALGIPALGGFIVLSPALAGVLVGPDYAPAAARMMPLIAVGVFLANLRMHYFAHAVDLAGRTTLFLTASVPSAMLNVLVNVMLLPRIGLMAAVWSTILAYGLQLAITVVQSRRVYPLPFPWRDAARAALGTFGMCSALLAIPSPPGVVGLVADISIGVIVYGMLALAFDIGEVRSIAVRAIAPRWPGGIPARLTAFGAAAAPTAKERRTDA